MTTQQFRTVTVDEGDGQTSTIQVPVSPSTPSPTPSSNTVSSTNTEPTRTVEVQEGDGQTSTIQVPIQPRISTPQISDQQLQRDLSRVSEDGVTRTTQPAILSSPSAERRVSKLSNKEEARIRRELSKEGLTDRESRELEERLITQAEQRQQRQRIEELSKQREETLKQLQKDSPVDRTVIPDKNVVGFLGEGGKNVDAAYRLKDGETLYYLNTGRVVIFTTGDENIPRFELLSPKLAEQKSDRVLSEIQRKEERETLAEILAANPNIPPAKIAEAFAAQKIKGQENVREELGEFGKELGLSLIPIYGTYRDAKRLGEEWDDLSNAERARNTALTSLSAIGDVTLVFGTTSKISSIALKSTKDSSIILKATTDSVSEATKIANTVKAINKVNPNLEVVSSSNVRYLQNVAKFSEDVGDKKAVFEIAIEPTARGIRDAGVVDDLLKGRPEALELIGRRIDDASEIRRPTQGVIEIDKSLSNDEIQKIADAIRGDTEINSIVIRAVERPNFSGDTLERVVDERMLLWEKQYPKATSIEKDLAREEFREKLSTKIVEGRTIEDSAKLLQDALKQKNPVRQRSGILSKNERDKAREAANRRDIETKLEVDKPTPLDNPKILKKEEELRKAKERLARTEESLNLDELFNSPDIDKVLAKTADSRGLERLPLSLPEENLVKKINRLEDEIVELRKNDKIKSVETRAVRLEPENRRTGRTGSDDGGGVAVLTKTDDASSLKFSSGLRTTTKPKTVKAVSPIFIADFERVLQGAPSGPDRTPSTSPQRIASPDIAPGGGPSDAPGPSEQPQSVPDPDPDPEPSPDPTPSPQPQPKPDPSRVRVDQDRSTSRTRTVIPPRGRLPGVKSDTIEVEGIQIPIEGTVGWKQGFGWYVLYPPYRQSNLIFTRERPIGIVIRKNAESAVRYVVLSGGKIPRNTRLKIGAFELRITSKGREPEFEFKRIKRIR